MSIEDRIITGWRLPHMPPSERAGTALSRELIEKEQRFGLTGQVAWAYARAFPTLLGASTPNALPQVHPLHCSQGVLRAAAIHYHEEDEQALLSLPPIDFVQTSSPQVCRLLAGRVQIFHVDNRDALETIKYHHHGVTHVYAHEVEPSPNDEQAPCRITHIQKQPPYQRQETLPLWYTATRHREEFIPLLKFDHDIWLCWHLYKHRACLVEGRAKILATCDEGPADVVPERVVRSWLYPGQISPWGGRGWAATQRSIDQRVERIMSATTDRRWLLMSSFERTMYNQELIAAWRARQPLNAIADTPDFARANMVSLELEEDTIQYSWIGTHRVLRLRDNILTQLTEDHDLLYAKKEAGEPIDEELQKAAEQFDYVVAKALPQDTPAHGSSDLRAGDRYILLEKSAQKILAQHLEGHLSLEKFFSLGSPHDVAQRALNILARTRAYNSDILLVIDSDAQVIDDPDRSKRLLARQSAETTSGSKPPSPTVRALVESPKEYDGQLVDTRGVLNWAFEQHRFAEAWFEPTVRPNFAMGSWLVHMRGTWHSDGTPRGHLGMSKSLIRGEVDLISIEHPERARSSNLFQVTPYVPLQATAMIERGLTGWTCQGKWLHRMGSDCRLPEPDVPDLCRAEIVYFVDQFGVVGLFSWKILAEFRRAPKRFMPGQLIHAAKGTFIETTGLLVPHESDRELSQWPQLEGGVRVILPAYSRTGERYTIPNRRMLHKPMEVLGKSGKIVKVRGEIAHTYRDVSHKETRPDGTIYYRHESIAYNILYATQIFDPDGTLLDL